MIEFEITFRRCVMTVRDHSLPRVGEYVACLGEPPALVTRIERYYEKSGDVMFVHVMTDEVA